MRETDLRKRIGAVVIVAAINAIGLLALSAVDISDNLRAWLALPLLIAAVIAVTYLCVGLIRVLLRR
jgi:hypothetical protein